MSEVCQQPNPLMQAHDADRKDCWTTSMLDGPDTSTGQCWMQSQLMDCFYATLLSRCNSTTTRWPSTNSAYCQPPINNQSSSPYPALSIGNTLTDTWYTHPSTNEAQQPGHVILKQDCFDPALEHDHGDETSRFSSPHVSSKTETSSNQNIVTTVLPQNDNSSSAHNVFSQTGLGFNASAREAAQYLTDNHAGSRHQSIDAGSLCGSENDPLDSPRSMLSVEDPPDLRCWEHGCEGRAFTNIENFRRHMREKSGKKRVRCELCMQSFSRRSTLQKHLMDRRCPCLNNDQERPRRRRRRTAKLSFDKIPQEIEVS